MDISDFYRSIFDEADELLADMEQHLLDLVPESPDAEQLNTPFSRAAHSIKRRREGTFGFTYSARKPRICGKPALDGPTRWKYGCTGIINLF